jgi:hypothetical protein
MIGLVLLWVGAVLTLNGLWLMGRIGDREIAVINVFAGGIAFLAAVVSAFSSGAEVTGGIAFGALVLLFAFTYLWVAINRIFQLDGRGLGWYSLFVAITAVPIGIEILMGAQKAWDWWLGLNWLAWGVLWFFYFILLVPRRLTANFVGAVTLVEGILTAWLPAYLILRGHLAI